MTSGLWASLAAMAAPAGAPEPRIFHARDFGAVPDSGMDAGDAIRAALAAALAAGPGATVQLEAGTYRVSAGATRAYCFPIRDAHELTVRGASDRRQRRGGGPWLLTA